MKTLFKYLSAAALLCISYTANAVLIYGTQAGTSIADCPSFCTNFNFGPSLGGENITDTGISTAADLRGDAAASAQLTGGLNTPVLKAKSEANPTLNGAFATAFGVQGYTYNGQNGSLTLNINLDGFVIDMDGDPLDTNVFMEVVLYSTENFAFFSDRGTLDFEFGAMPLIQNDMDMSEASVQLQLDFSNPIDFSNTMSDSGQISIDVSTGDEFYIWAFLRTEARSGLDLASADAFNTGTMSFLGNPNLIAASSSSVPVPAAIWLFGSGFIGLASLARRKLSQ